MQTNRTRERRLDLDSTFSVPLMRKVWKKTVRSGLRGQAILDLHDFMDVHVNLEPYLRRLRTNVLEGRFRPSPAEITRLEKRDGISRRIPLPAPADALLLQTLVEVMQTAIEQHAPSQNAFYSRSHGAPDVDRVDGTFAYPWWILWPEFQKRIWKFTEDFDYLVVTDVANYYDSVPLNALRNTLASFGVFKEILLDFLFYMLEAYSWRPDYIPATGVGLPQINFDAPRLLAHAYLFAADRELANTTRGNFVRWMDDIDFGADSVIHARSILAQLETALNSIGLRLNAGKTKILRDHEAVAHFWMQENRELTIVKNLLQHGAASHPSSTRIPALLKRRFQRFRARPRIGNWDKVYKRYLGLFGEIGDSYLQRFIPDVLENQPGLREAAFRYYQRLGYSTTRFTHIRNYLQNGYCLDDASRFEAVKLLTDWTIPRRGRDRKSCVLMAGTIGAGAGTTPAQVTCGLWLLTKYGTVQELEDYLIRTRLTWNKSEWAARQIAAVHPRLSAPAKQLVEQELSANGLLEGLSVLSNIHEMGQLMSLGPIVQPYLFHPPTATSPYPLHKILIALTILEGSLPAADKANLKAWLTRSVQDRVYADLLA